MLFRSVNHEIRKKGDDFPIDAIPRTPPNKAGHFFRGWGYENTDTSPTFTIGCFDMDKIENDITVYAVYRKLSEIPLNGSGNVYVMPKNEPTGELVLEVKAKNSTGDMRIQREKWIEMAKWFAAYESYGTVGWSLYASGVQITISFHASVKAPSNMKYMFNNFDGNIVGLDKLDVSEVTDASASFNGVEGEVRGADFRN